MHDQSVAIRDLHLLVVGVVRNCESTLIEDVERLKSAFGGFASIKWFLVESDSNDASVELLGDLKSKDTNFDYQTLGDLKDLYPLRTDRIAFCRNKYVEQINTDPNLANTDYIVVADFDGINNLIDKCAVESCWENQSGWGMVAANQNGPYYDIWALRHEIWSPNDCWKQFEFLKRLGLSDENSRFSAVLSRMVKIPPEHDWLEVNSAFGGLAIYQKRFFKDAKYIGLDEDKMEVCEHVSLHSMMRSRGAKLFINPQLINNAGYNEHSRHLKPLFKAIRMVWGVTSRLLTLSLGEQTTARIKDSLQKRF